MCWRQAVCPMLESSRGKSRCFQTQSACAVYGQKLAFQGVCETGLRTEHCCLLDSISTMYMGTVWICKPVSTNISTCNLDRCSSFSPSSRLPPIIQSNGLATQLLGGYRWEVILFDKEKTTSTFNTPDKGQPQTSGLTRERRDERRETVKNEVLVLVG